MRNKINGIHDFVALIGKNLGVTVWHTIDQAKLDAFAEVTGDRDWLHNDPERAAKESPFANKTIAQGFLLLSHLPQFHKDLLPLPPNVAYALNYGLNRVRFINPVSVGSRFRNRMKLKDLREKGDGHFIIITENFFELEGSEEPALVAEWLGMMIKA